MKSSKKTRIEKMIKKYGDTSPYLLNKFSRSVYTHADLDIIEELLQEGYFYVSLRGFSQGEIVLEKDHGPSLRGSFYNLKRKDSVWNGRYHFNAIRRGLKNLHISQFYHSRFDDKFVFWANPEYEWFIDVDQRRINWWTNNGSPVDLNKFKESIVDVMSTIAFRNDSWEYHFIQNPDDLIIGLEVVKLPTNVDDPYLDWSADQLEIEISNQTDLNGNEITKAILKRKDGEDGGYGVSSGIVHEGKLHVHEIYQTIGELWRRAGFPEIVWDGEVEELVIVEEVAEEE